MTRLADRLLEGCQPARASMMVGRAEVDDFVRSQLSAQLKERTTPEQFDHLVSLQRKRFLAAEPVAKEKFDSSHLQGVPIFAADEVALYVNTLPQGTEFKDVVASMAPPFDKFFIEFQEVPNGGNLHAWGTLVEAHEYSESFGTFEEDDGTPRWILEFETFLERDKGKPFGPVASHVAGLAEDGTWFQHADKSLWWAGGPVGIFPSDPPADVVKSFGDTVAQLLFPALFTISLLHCKNVQLREITPPEKRSRKHRKKHHRDLVRYHVLDIEPMRRLLDRYRTGPRSGLRQALHICRGHFKTFGQDAPLLGRHTGTFWWAPQVRGSKDVGVVLKDYRVSMPAEFGRAYREADETVPESDREAPPSKDPDSVGRGLAAHNMTQNKIAAVVRKLGWMPRSPAPGEPDFDIAWKTDETLFVCEVKSLSPTNEERQLRIAIGQVIRYRQKLAACGYEPVTAVIATECRPKDRSWEDLCDFENILLVWPEVCEERLQGAVQAIRKANTVAS